MKKQLYPQNMQQKPKLWLWSIRDLLIIGGAGVLSVFMAVKFDFQLPAALTAVYSFLCIRLDDQSIFDYILRAVRFFVTGQQSFVWKEDRK